LTGHNPKRPRGLTPSESRPLYRYFGVLNIFPLSLCDFLDFDITQSRSIDQ